MRLRLSIAVFCHRFFQVTSFISFSSAMSGRKIYDNLSKISHKEFGNLMALMTNAKSSDDFNSNGQVLY